jgi:type IV pilus assembly protein PilB
MAHSLKDKLTEILIDTGLLTREKLQEAVGIQKEKGGRLSDILVQHGFVDENALMLVLSERLHIPPIRLARFKIDKAMTKLVPRSVAKHYQIMPVSKTDTTLVVAVADPLNIFAMDDVRMLTGLNINPIITTPEDIRHAIAVYYDEETVEVLGKIVKEMENVELQMVQETRDEEKSRSELLRMVDETPVVSITNLLLVDAVRLRASDILLEPMETHVRVRYRIDGILHEHPAPPRSIHAAVVSRIKVMASLDIAEHRLPQDGRFKVRLHEGEVDFRASIIPSSFGEKVALRILDKSQAVLDIEKLGFSTTAIQRLISCAKRPHGMILICGPTGSGKTTTLYSVLKYVDTPEKNIVTVEDPVEYILDGINQVSIRQEIGLTFPAVLRSILRQDPNVIMIGEIRDFETVDIAIKAALTGHLVLSTLHTTDAAGSVVRLVNMGVEPYLIVSSIMVAAAQRLVRKICTKCKEPYSVPDDVKRALGMNTMTLFRGKGCAACASTGYNGRAGIIEVLLLSSGICELILKRSPESAIKAKARQEGMRTLREDGMRMVTEGITTPEEVLRLTGSDEPLPV